VRRVGAPRGTDKIAVRVDRALSRRKVAKHFTVGIGDDSLSYHRNRSPSPAWLPWTALRAAHQRRASIGLRCTTWEPGRCKPERRAVGIHQRRSGCACPATLESHRGARGPSRIRGRSTALTGMLVISYLGDQIVSRPV